MNAERGGHVEFKIIPSLEWSIRNQRWKINAKNPLPIPLSVCVYFFVGWLGCLSASGLFERGERNEQKCFVLVLFGEFCFCGGFL